RISVVPYVSVAPPTTAISEPQRSVVRSAVPSPFGENDTGATDSTMTGSRDRTVTFQLRAARLPAGSETPRLTRYVPSPTAAPASLCPFHVTLGAPPAPTIVR